MLVSIVIPCYRSQDSIRRTVELTMEEFRQFEGYECEFILVDDCSPDNTYSEIRALAREYTCVHGISLMRNFGQHNAIMCGLSHAFGDLIMGMDDDLQTHPSQIKSLLLCMETGNYDVVYGVYEELNNGPIKNFTSWINRVTVRILLNRPKNIETSNFWLIKRCVRDEAVKFNNYNPFVEALFGCVTTNIGNVAIKHFARDQGRSGYTFKKLAQLWLSYFNYTVVPLRLISGVGICSALAGFLYALFVVIQKLAVPDIQAGWSSIVCLLLFFFGLILLSLGIIGEYLANLVLPANGTSQFIVRSTTDDDVSRDSETACS